MTPCVLCQRPVLEIPGEFAALDAFYIQDGSPPESSAGTWHTRCLAASEVAPLWYDAHLRNFKNVRGFAPIAELARWTVVAGNRDKRYAFGRDGEVLDLSIGVHPIRDLSGGKLYRGVQEPFFLGAGDTSRLAAVSQHLEASGSYPVLALFEEHGIVDRIAHAEALGESRFELDKSLRDEWPPPAVAVRLAYARFVPHELVPYVGEFVR